MKKIISIIILLLSSPYCLAMEPEGMRINYLNEEKKSCTIAIYGTPCFFLQYNANNQEVELSFIMKYSEDDENTVNITEAYATKKRNEEIQYPLNTEVTPQFDALNKYAFLLFEENILN